LLGVDLSGATASEIDEEEADVATPLLGSAKLALLVELLEQAREGGHRVLIFSQFVSMLKLISEQLDERGQKFAYLDGSTKDRQTEVDRFQSDDKLLAFLISLKAGGTGLNLTAADTVIHFDPWWNPAVQAQASDRAHRIGQKRVVTTYQLITRDTVEEKILKLQRRKRDATEAVIERDGFAAALGGLTMSEMTELLS
jgi:SNF2 family DNA or RNA helicase